jgi:hypothetical protein
LKAILLNSVALGGDVDAVGSLASHAEEVQQDLPQWLSNDLENNPYGLEYIQQVDERRLKLV